MGLGQAHGLSKEKLKELGITAAPEFFKVSFPSNVALSLGLLGDMFQNKTVNGVPKQNVELCPQKEKHR